MDQEANSSIPVPTFPSNTWPLPIPNPNPFTGYTCPNCGNWVQNGTFHQCPGWTPGVITTDNTFSGFMAEISMYADFVKLLRRDTIALIRNSLLDKLHEIENANPENIGPVLFDSDLIEELFDDVAKSIRDKSSV